MPLRFERRLIDHIRHESYEAATVSRLAADLGIGEGDRADFEQAIDDLIAQGRLQRDEQGKVRLPSLGKEIIGKFKANQRGFGFVIPEQTVAEGDVFVPPGATMSAMTGDRVRVAISRERRRGQMETTGTVVEILERGKTSMTGELRKQGPTWLVQPDGKNFRDPIVVTDPGAKNAKAGDKVVVEILHYPEDGILAEGVITKVLGEAGEPDVETQSVIAAFGLPSNEFPKGVVEHARRVTAEFEEEVERLEKEGYDRTIREDHRETFTATIDPPDARDYDDAISIRRTEDGDGWELIVHIADVSHFVTAGSPMDVEAHQRGNSVYLPRLVIPMLPEILSNGICSLAEGVTRFTKSAFMRYDRQGRRTGEGVANTVIKSNKRLTYLEAQALIDGDIKEARKHAKTEPKYTDELIQALREMNTLAHAIRERRRKAGMIHLELPDAELEFDDSGRVIDVHPEDDAFTHTLIEMFMVEANEVLARLFEGLGVPLLRRIHPEPTPGDTEELRISASVAGIKIPKSPTREELQSILDATAGTPIAPAVHMALLRTLSKAEYSPALVGHFALASEAYAHFTSPIRRYPDLTVHRALAEYLKRTDNGEKIPTNENARRNLGSDMLDSGKVPNQDELVIIGRHCSNTEVQAQEAERDLRQFLVLQFLETKAGEDFPAIVTGVSPRQVFVQIEKYRADGAIPTSDLPGGQGGPGGWRIDQRTGSLVNASTGRSFRIGDRVTVRIAEIDLSARRLTVVLADSKSRDVGKRRDLTGGLGEGGLNIDWDAFKGRKSTGAEKRSRRSKQRDRGKTEHRNPRKGKKK